MKLLEEGINLKEIYGSSELNILMRTYPHNRSNRRIESMRLMPLPGMDTHVEMQADDAGFYELVAHQVEPRQVFRTNDLFVRDEVMGEVGLKEREGLVRAAMLVGHRREKTGLLVELREDVDMENFHDAMGRIVQRVNKGLREKARVSSDMVMTLEKGMELPVRVKGNIKRKEAHDTYQAEIGALYSG
ncbi:MAG: hypothetical protein Q9199_005592 [Rusavskia elegans]